MISSMAASGTLTAAHRGYRARPPSSATASCSLPGSRPAVMSPSRWQQVIPAACMNVGQADQRRGLGQPGGAQPAGVQGRQPAPAGQGSGQRVGDVAPLGLVAAGEEVLPGERGCFQQRRRGSGPGPAPPAAPGRRAPER